MPHSTFIRDLNERQKLWRLSEPSTYDDYSVRDDSNDPLKRPFNHVVTSICSPDMIAMQGCPECYIFPADADGKILNWAELPGSQKQTTSHTLVLTDMGFPPVNSDLTP